MTRTNLWLICPSCKQDVALAFEGHQDVPAEYVKWLAAQNKPAQHHLLLYTCSCCKTTLSGSSVVALQAGLSAERAVALQ